MQVEAILEEKGRQVVSVGPTTSVSDAIDVLDQENIGAVLVLSDNEELVGVLSERDVIRALRRAGSSALGLPVSDLMTRAVVTCDPDTESESLMERMVAERIRHLPVLRDGQLSGIISIGDVVKQVVSDLKSMKSVLEDQVVRSVAWSTEED